ncbi:MAG: hypothetical protein ACQGVC_00820 [Myxococcota bacterium]
MRGIARIRGSDAHRVRRWDVVMLGSALPGLVAAVRLGQRGARVLVVEEKAAAEAPALLREPFVLTGADSAGVLGQCLRTLGLALIDQRRFAPEEVAVQVVLPDARVDVGRAALTAAELVAWGLAKPDEARALVRALEGAAQAERAALLAGPQPRRRGRGEPADAAGFARGWPREAAEAGEPLAPLLAALIRGLSNLGEAAPSPEARARLVGALLEGGWVLGGADRSLRGMIRRRAEALFAQFRSLDRPFEFVSVTNQPGLSLRDPDEILSGRVMVLNAPLAGLRRACEGEVPDVLRGPEPALRRVQRYLRGPADALPEGMASRVICVPATATGEAPVVTLRTAAGPDRRVEAVAEAVGPLDAPTDGMTEWIDRVLARLLPFAAGRLETPRLAPAVWDTDTLLCDPGAAGAWPGLPSSRLSGRPPIHHLDRAAVGGLGFEGDLLLGLHAAEEIAAELPSRP